MKFEHFKQMMNHRKNRILIVDDEEFCIATMQSLFTAAKVDIKNNVDFCINGEEALEQVKTSYALGMTYSIIFTDFSMPIMDGIQSTYKIRDFLTNELKLQGHDQPIIIGVTAHVEQSFKQEGINAGMNEV